MNVKCCIVTCTRVYTGLLHSLHTSVHKHDARTAVSSREASLLLLCAAQPVSKKPASQRSLCTASSSLTYLSQHCQLCKAAWQSLQHQPHATDVDCSHPAIATYHTKCIAVVAWRPGSSTIAGGLNLCAAGLDWQLPRAEFAVGIHFVAGAFGSVTPFRVLGSYVWCGSTDDD